MLRQMERSAIHLMAKRGKSIRQIAEDLFLTLRTVEAHLTSAYRKLDIDGRPQLAAALGR